MALVTYHPWELEEIVIAIVFCVLWFRGGTLIEKAFPLGKVHEKARRNVRTGLFGEKKIQNDLNVRQEGKKMNRGLCLRCKALQQ